MADEGGYVYGCRQKRQSSDLSIRVLSSAIRRAVALSTLRMQPAGIFDAWLSRHIKNSIVPVEKC